MPAQAGIHGFPKLQPHKSWMAARSLPSGLTRGAAMTEMLCRGVIVSAGWYKTTRKNRCSISGVADPHRHGLRRQAIHVLSEISTATREMAGLHPP